MKTRSILNCLKPLLLVVLSGFTQSGYGDTRTYAATTDFPITDAGVVPYYSEAPGRPSLAINAADESYRDLFARAEVVYDGNEGLHTITIVALAELDGEADYQLLVNGDVVGTASNPEVSVDYTVVRHTFPDISIPAGAVLGVESLANTNGKIPEGDGTAFARGRWTALELVETVEEVVVEQAPTDIDLGLVLTSNAIAVNQNEPFNLDITVSNATGSSTATQPEVAISLALQAISIISADQCTQNTLGLICTFPELPAGTSQSMTLSLSSTDEVLQLVVQASASADQNDRDGTNNTTNLSITVNNIDVEPEPEPLPTDVVEPNDQSTSTPSSGGGALSLAWLLLFFPAIRRSIKISSF